MSRKISHSLVSGRAGAGTGGQGLKIEWDSTNDGELHWMDVDENSLEPIAWGGSRGVIAPGYKSGYNTDIEYIAIATTGNSVDFGDLLTASQERQGLSNGSRGLFGSGHKQSFDINEIDYITISTTGNEFIGLIPSCSNLTMEQTGRIGTAKFNPSG